MKRYNLETVPVRFRVGETQKEMVGNDNGEWVRYEDVIKMLDDLDKDHEQKKLIAALLNMNGIKI